MFAEGAVPLAFWEILKGPEVIPVIHVNIEASVPKFPDAFLPLSVVQLSAFPVPVQARKVKGKEKYQEGLPRYKIIGRLTDVGITVVDAP